MKAFNKKSNENFLIINYKKCFEFFRESRWFMVTSLGIFTFFFLVGFSFPIFFREQIILLIEEIRLSIVGLNAMDLTFFIFSNNLRAAFFSIILGIFIGIFPLFVAVFNGYLIGFVSREVSNVAGIFELWRLLPHGIFELPAIILCVGFGMKIGFEIFSKDSIKKIQHNLTESLRFFISVILPLLIIAAIIECLLIAFFS